ncbi:MAG: alpha/beta hydrolase [Asgard group archaeon]|nr:alpha/beta hydrolase [Asgard group archaeon]
MDQSIMRFFKLQDGRTLCYTELGNPKAKPLFHFHGWPGSCFEAKFGEVLIPIANARIISVNRPGIGLSDRKKNRKLLEWPDDVAELADYLDLNRFSIMGVSGGAASALACAYKIPDRVKSVGIVSGLGPFYMCKDHVPPYVKFLLTTGRRMKWLVKIVLWFFFARPFNSKNQERSKAKMYSRFEKILTKQDLEFFKNEEILDIMWNQIKEAFTLGIKGVCDEGSLYITHWGFDLEEIPKNVGIYVWHGELDPLIPVCIGRQLAEAIPHCNAVFYPNEGHYSTLFNYIGDMISTLV